METTKLNLSHQNLTKIPEEVFTKYPHLEALDLSNNNLKALDKRLQNLTSLKILDISNNEKLGIHFFGRNFTWLREMGCQIKAHGIGLAYCPEGIKRSQIECEIDFVYMKQWEAPSQSFLE